MISTKTLPEGESRGSIARVAVVTFLLVAAVAACFWPLARNPTGILAGSHDGGRNDLTCQFLAFRDLPRIAWQQSGQVPLWNPYLLTGTPWYGNPQSGLFYPPNWLFLLFPAARIISWILVLHHVWGGVGAMLLSRRYGCSWPAAATAAIVFLAAPYLIAHTGEGHYNQVCLVAWVPWAFLGWERWRERKRGSVALLALVLSLCFFCGHVQELYYLMVILSVLTLVETARVLRRTAPGEASSPTPRRAAGALLGRWILTCLAVAGLTAGDLIPIWFYSRSAVRAAGLSAADASQFSLGPASLLQLFDPDVWGGPDNYRGPGGYYWETLCHFGLVPLLLAGLGSLSGWRRFPVLRFLLLALLTTIFAFGNDLPLFSWMYRIVPGVSLFRAPGRALFFASLAVAVLAAFGLDAARTQIWRGRPLAPRRKWLLYAVGVAAAAGAMLAVGALLAGQAGPDRGPRTMAVDWRPALAWTAAALAFLVLAIGWPSRRPWIVGILSVLCAAELATHAHRVLAVIDRGDVRWENPVLRGIQPGSQHARLLATQDLVGDWEAWQRGWHKVHGYDPVPQARAGLLLAALAPRQHSPDVLGEHVRLEDLHKPLVDLLGVRFAAVPGPPQPQAGWQPISQGSIPPPFRLPGDQRRAGRYTVYRNETALPRAFLLGRATVLAPGDDALERLAQLAPRDAVLLGRDVLPPGPRQPFAPAEIVEYRPNRVAVQCELTAPGYLVLTDLYAPGWRAEVDGKPAPVLTADLALRAVPLEHGRHLVRFCFEPVGARAGLLIALLTLLAVLVTTVSVKARRMP